MASEVALEFTLEDLAKEPCYERDRDIPCAPTAPCCAPCLARALLPRWRKLEALHAAVKAWRKNTTLTPDTEHLWPNLAAIRVAVDALGEP